MIKIENIHIVFNNSLMFNIEDIQMFGLNMPFISSSEVKNAYFMRL